MLVNDELLIYPNPVGDNLNLEIRNFDQSKKYKLVIYDSMGRKVKNYIINENNSSINISSLSTGIYIIAISDEKKMITKKIYKK